MAAGRMAEGESALVLVPLSELEAVRARVFPRRVPVQRRALGRRLLLVSFLRRRAWVSLLFLQALQRAPLRRCRKVPESRLRLLISWLPASFLQPLLRVRGQLLGALF